MFTATANLILPSTTTGSFPRPPWYDVSMWGRPLDTCVLDVRFREKFQDAMAVLISDQERAGLDILLTETCTSMRTWPAGPGIITPCSAGQDWKATICSPRRRRRRGCTIRRAHC